MATAVASRFAVLSIDDDEDSPKRNQKKKAENKKIGTGGSAHKADPNQKKKNKKCETSKVSVSKIHEQTSHFVMDLRFSQQCL
jgi:hypothetical protein